MMPGWQLRGFVGWLLVCASVAGLGALASVDAELFYSELTRPQWAPPGWLFGPVWSVLYLLMAVSVWLVWRQRMWGKRLPLTVFVLQLMPNALWSWLFFEWRLGSWAMLDVLILCALVVLNIALFWQKQRLAALLLLPYLIWIVFAAGLNWSVWQLNPVLLG